MKQRVRFTKRGKVRFLSHRDLARIWERALRRAEIRVSYSEGFSPRPKVSFGLALSTGYESLGEYLDIDLAEDIEPEELVALVNPSLPAGIEAQVAIRIPRGHRLAPAGGHQLGLGDRGPWGRPERMQEVVAAALASEALPIVVERKGSETDLDARPAILALEARGSVLFAELATQPRSLRPAELLRALDPTWTAGSVVRTNQWTSVDGARCEPIPFGDLGARARRRPHTRKRVCDEKGSHE